MRRTSTTVHRNFQEKGFTVAIEPSVRQVIQTEKVYQSLGLLASRLTLLDLYQIIPKGYNESVRRFDNAYFYLITHDQEYLKNIFEASLFQELLLTVKSEVYIYHRYRVIVPDNNSELGFYVEDHYWQISLLTNDYLPTPPYFSDKRGNSYTEELETLIEIKNRNQPRRYPFKKALLEILRLIVYKGLRRRQDIARYRSTSESTVKTQFKEIRDLASSDYELPDDICNNVISIAFYLYLIGEI